MGQFSWNGSLTRIAVGGICLLLALSFKESVSYVSVVQGLNGELSQANDLLTAGIAICVTYCFGAIFTEYLPRSTDWNQVLVESLKTGNIHLFSLVTEERTKCEMLVGLGRSFALFAGLGGYNSLLALFKTYAGVTSVESSSFTQLSFAVFFGTVISWLLFKYSQTPIETALSMVKHYQASEKPND